MKQNADTKPAAANPSSARSDNALADALHRLAAEDPRNDNVAQHDSPTAAAVERLAFYGLDHAAIAILLGCSPMELANRFGNALALGQARQQQFLLEKLAERVDLGEWPALRFALKNYCNLADNPDPRARQQSTRLGADVPGATASPGVPPPEQAPEAQSGYAPQIETSSAAPANPRPRVRPRYQGQGQTGGPDATAGIAR